MRRAAIAGHWDVGWVQQHGSGPPAVPLREDGCARPLRATGMWVGCSSTAPGRQQCRLERTAARGPCGLPVCELVAVASLPGCRCCWPRVLAHGVLADRRGPRDPASIALRNRPVPQGPSAARAGPPYSGGAPAEQQRAGALCKLEDASQWRLTAETGAEVRGIFRYPIGENSPIG